MTTTNEQQLYERRKSTIEGVQGPRDGAPQWLNSVDVVNGLVRRFGAEVLRRVSMGPGGHLQSWCESKCLQLNGLFLGFGRNDEAHTGYSRGNWNTNTSWAYRSPSACG